MSKETIGFVRFQIVPARQNTFHCTGTRRKRKTLKNYWPTKKKAYEVISHDKVIINMNTLVLSVVILPRSRPWVGSRPRPGRTSTTSLRLSVFRWTSRPIWSWTFGILGFGWWHTANCTLDSLFFVVWTITRLRSRAWILFRSSHNSLKTKLIGKFGNF